MLTSKEKIGEKIFEESIENDEVIKIQSFYKSSITHFLLFRIQLLHFTSFF